MKSKVIIFCVLLFCSKFVVSVSFNEESIQQRAYQPSNWQGNQNIADNYQGNGFAQTQNINSMNNAGHPHDHSHEYIANPGRQNYDKYGFNNNPLMQQSPPIKDSQVNFAPESHQKKDTFPPGRGDSLSNRPDNQLLRGDQQYRQNNWQAQNRLVNPAVSASVASIPERPVRERYNVPSQHAHYIPPTVYQADAANPVVRDTHYHPVAERPTNIRYMQQDGMDSGLRNRPGQNENFNEAHATGTNTKVPKSGNNGFIENSSLYSTPTNSQPYEGYSGPPAVAPEVMNNRGIHQMRRGNRNTNVPNTFNSGRPIPSNTVGNNENIRYQYRNPPGYSAPNTYEMPIAPTNSAMDRPDRFSESEPKAPRPVNNYGYPQHTPFKHNNAPNTYNPSMTPDEVELDKMSNNKYMNSPVIESDPNYQPPHMYNEGTTDYNLPNIDGVPLTDPVPVNNYDETPLTPNNMINKDRKLVGPKPMRDFGPSPTVPEDDNLYKNIYNHVSTGSGRGNIFNNPKYKDIFKSKARFMIVHANGTVEHVDDMDEVRQNNQNYIIIKKTDKPLDGSDNQPPVKSPSSYKGPLVPNYPESPSNKTDYNSPSRPMVPRDNDFNQPPGPRRPSNNNSYTPSPSPKSPNSNEYYPSSAPVPPSSNENYPSSIPQPPESNDKSPSQYPTPLIDEEYGTSPAPQSPNSDNYKPPSEMPFPSDKDYPRNGTRDNDYPTPPLKKDSDKLTTTTKPPVEELLRDFFDSLANKTDNNPPSDSRPIVPSGKEKKPTSKEDSPSQIPFNTTTFSPNNDYPYNSTQNETYTTPKSKLHTVISPGIYKTTTPKPSDDKDNEESTSATLGSKENKNKKETPKPLGPNDNPDNTPLYVPLAPSNGKKKPSSIALHPDDEDSLKPSSTLLPPKDNDKKKPAPVPNKDEKKSTPKPLSPTESSDKKPLTTPSDQSENNNSSETNPPNDKNSKEYNSTQDNDYSTPPSKLYTASDEQIQQYLDSLTDKTDDGKPSRTNQNDQKTESDENIYTTTPLPPPSKSSTLPSNVTISPMETTTDNDIITISPIEQVTDNVKNGSSLEPVNTVTRPYDKNDKTTTETPSSMETDDLSGFIIKIISDNNNKTTEIANKKDTPKKEVTESATNDNLTNTDVPATPGDNPAVATNSTKQTDVYTGDNYTIGDYLVESKPNTSDITITLTIPNDSDGNVTIKVEVPESTGDEDTSGDGMLVVNINTRNCSDTDSVTTTKISPGPKSYDKDPSTGEDDAKKNFVIDMYNSAIFMNKTADKELFEDMIKNTTVAVLYVFQVHSKPIIERNKTTTYFANNTVVEEIIETTWQNKDDAEPSVITMKKIYHKGDNN